MKKTILFPFLAGLLILAGSCKKDESKPANTAPTGMATSAPTDVTSDGASLHGIVGATGGDNLTTFGFAYSSTIVSPTIDDGVVQGIDDDGTALGAFTARLSGLAKNTQYYVRAFATNKNGVSYGSGQTFTTTAGGNPSVESLVVGNWKLTTYKENDVEKPLGDCDKDDIWQFKSGGGFTLNFSSVKCGSEPDAIDDNWSLASDTMLNIFGLNHINLMVNATTMSFDFTGTDGIKKTRIYTRQ